MINALRIIGFISAAILTFFGVLFIWGAFSKNGNPNWIPVGCITVLIAFGLIVLSAWGLFKKSAAESATNVTLKVDLPASSKLEAMKCKSCGGALTSENITMVNGAPMVNCPYCNTVYQIVEEPKW